MWHGQRFVNWHSIGAKSPHAILTNYIQLNLNNLILIIKLLCFASAVSTCIVSNNCLVTLYQTITVSMIYKKKREKVFLTIVHFLHRKRFKW